MLISVGEFKDKVHSRLDVLVEELEEWTGRSSPEEKRAWQESLPKIATAFASKSFDPLHMYFGEKGKVALEYQLPASSSWCDIVLLGRHRGQCSAVIVELKNWSTRSDEPGAVEGLMKRLGEPVLHPSDQVRGYTEYCRRFHSAVHEYEAIVSGCVIFTKDVFVDRYREKPNDIISRAYPCFTLSLEDIQNALPNYFSQRLTEADDEFAKAFDGGGYRQDRGFVRQIGQQILDPAMSQFELLDNQRRAFSVTQALVDKSLFSEEAPPKKQVIVIDGPPGSGKSVLAAKIWAHLVTDNRLPDGSVVFTTTSASQNSNWAYLFRQAAHDAAASGVVKKAASYTPISTQALGRLRKRHGESFLSDALVWRENIRTLRSLGTEFHDGARDEQYLVSIVDEAHALINPEGPEGRGQYGFAPTLGPQAYHIIRTSTISIFLLDAQQSFRDRENTTVADIKKWGSELGAQVGDEISLAGAQFRCAGSREYVEWVETVLRGEPPDKARKLAKAWKDVLEFQVFDDPAELEAHLRQRMVGGKTARLLASYARGWKTKGAAVPHDLPDTMKDFHEKYVRDGLERYWSRVWNFVPQNGGDYTHFIQARPGSRIHTDQLCEVGCPYAVRGFDFDYVGLLWLRDILWREDRWVVNTEQVFESGLARSLSAAQGEADLDGPLHGALYNSVAQGYRILLTRPLRGIFLWVEDKETRRYIESCIA